MGKEFAEKLSKKTGGDVIDFPRVALAHCILKGVIFELFRDSQRFSNRT